MIVASAEDEILYEEDISVPEAEETNTEENNTEEIAVTDDEEVLDWDSLIEDADDLVEEQISENAIWGFRSWDEEEWASKYADRFTYTDTYGVTWYCVRFMEAPLKCAVYGCSNALPEISIPSKVFDDAGNSLTVTAVVSVDEGKGYLTNSWQFKNNILYNDHEDYKLYGVSIPDTVDYIGVGTFNSFSNLAWVILPNNPSLKIGASAFEECTKLLEIKNRGSAENGTVQATFIGEYAFLYCKSLESIRFSVGAEIDPTALAGCTGLKSIYNAPAILDMCTSKVSSSEYKLETVSFAEGLTQIDGFVRSYRSEDDELLWPMSIKTVILPSTTKVIASCAFYGQENLTSINFPNGLTGIGDAAFYGCKNLHISVNYPGDDYVDSFAESGITDITFKSSVYEIHGRGFKGCSNLKSINVQSGNPYFFSQDGVLYTYVYDYNGNKIGKSLMKYPAGKNVGGSFTVPSDCPSIFGYTFDACRLKEIHVPVTVRIYDCDYMYNNDNGTWIYIYPFDNMASNCTIYLVKNSCIDTELDWNGVPDNCTLKYVPGPDVKITYVLNGGTNNSSNPKTVVGGNSVTLKPPVRSGYVFTGWKETSTGKYTPSDEELFKGVTFTATWKKQEVSVAKAEITGLSDKTYTGKALKPVPIVKLNGTTLKSGTDFTVAYKNNKAVGTATVTITGKGKYSGTVQKTFRILPKTTSVTKLTAGKKKLTVKWKKQTTQTSGYQLQYSTDKSFKTKVKTKNVSGAKKTLASLTKLSAKKTYYVRIRTYRKVGKAIYYSSWSKIKSKKTK